MFSLTVMSVSAHAAGVVADGGTATSVSTAASGHQTVSIAPAVGGVSHNTYNVVGQQILERCQAA
ncbi:hypothetical protein [Paraburkholderia terrae]|uniref:hypothetical protein n=1 Tax=Paraburkholderia TaxID=1822464 RepID=UPI001EE2C0B8|nr:hypothetical protein [Paraburkholderia terrae]GJH05689.1 hypothetical protein CBA19C8_34050 [Paraburkholderia terrae]